MVEWYFVAERAASWCIGPLDPVVAQGLHVSQFGVIPKGREMGKWRLITDLSFPIKGRVNDGISPALCSLQYTLVERVTRAAQALESGALLAKVDIKSV